jgi:hypothetical protein
MTHLATLKRRLLADPDTRAEYEAQAPEFAVAREQWSEGKPHKTGTLSSAGDAGDQVDRQPLTNLTA